MSPRPAAGQALRQHVLGCRAAATGLKRGWIGGGSGAGLRASLSLLLEGGQESGLSAMICCVCPVRWEGPGRAGLRESMAAPSFAEELARTQGP